ncbi:MAG: hypothetical protein ABIY62_08770 [Ginsengibacter sp.]
MRTANKMIATVIIFLSLTIIKSNSYSQVTPDDPTSLVQEFTINLDKLGNATMELTQKMTASQWGSFKQSQIYTDPAMARRDMERSMSTYVIDDFKRDMDDMNRQVKLTVKVISYAQYKGDGHWSLKIDSKNPQVTKLTDNAYMITGNAVMGNSLVQQIFKIYFPSNASKVTQTTDEFGKAIFTYDAGGGVLSYAKWNNILGLLLILGAIFFLVKPIQTQKFKTAAV